VDANSGRTGAAKKRRRAGETREVMEMVCELYLADTAATSTDTLSAAGGLKKRELAGAR